MYFEYKLLFPIINLFLLPARQILLVPELMVQLVYLGDESKRIEVEFHAVRIINQSILHDFP